MKGGTRAWELRPAGLVPNHYDRLDVVLHEARFRRFVTSKLESGKEND